MAMVSCISTYAAMTSQTMQVDPRVPTEAQDKFKRHLAQLFRTRDIDGKQASEVLARAYHDVTRKQILND